MMQHPIRGRSQQSAETVTAMRPDHDQVRPLPLGDAHDLHLGSSGNDNGPDAFGKRFALKQFLQAR